MMFGAWGNPDHDDAMGEDANQRGNSRRWIMRAVEDSLRRLSTTERYRSS